MRVQVWGVNSGGLIVRVYGVNRKSVGLTERVCGVNGESVWG